MRTRRRRRIRLRRRLARRAGQSGVPAAGGAIGDHRPRRQYRRSGQGRTDPPLPGCRRQAAGRTRSGNRRRPSAWAATVPDFSRCSTASRRNAVRSITRSSRCGRISIRSHQPRAAARRRLRRLRARKPAPLGSGWRWPRTIAARNTANAARGPGNFLRQSVRQKQQQQSGRARKRRSRARSPGPIAPFACATCDGFYFPISFATVPGAFPRRREDLQGALPGGGGHALQLIAIPART